MCDSIRLACESGSPIPGGATIDARGFSSPQVCKAGTATIMLRDCAANGGKLLLGLINLYVDGPSTPGNYQDTYGSGIGTPAFLIPSGFWGIEGVSRGSATPGPGTVLSVCTGSNTPVTGCTTKFPVRSFTITNVAVSGTTMTLTVSGLTIPPLSPGVNIFQGELGMIRSGTSANYNGTFRIQSIPTDYTMTMTVPLGTSTCASSCGNLYLGTPILGFEVGNPGGTNPNFYNATTCDSTCAAFGVHIKNLGFNCQDVGGCIGWQNLYAEEESGVDTFAVNQFNFAGFDSHGVHAQNFGPILNGEIYTGSGNSACDYGTVGGYIGDSARRGLNGWTINQSTDIHGVPLCGHEPIAGVMHDAPLTEVRNGHCEGFSNCVLMGANVGSLGGASGQRVSGIVGPPSGNAGTYVVQVSANNPNSDYVVSNLHAQTSGDMATFFDGNNGGIKISDPYLGLYAASQNSGLTNILTSDTSVPTRLDSGLTASFTSVLIANNSSFPPVVNELVKLTQPPLRVAVATTGDTVGRVVGVCVANCASTGNATVAVTGVVGCVFDGPTTATDWVVVSNMTGGDCQDSASVPPTSKTVIGHVLATTAGSGNTVNVLLQVAR